MSYLSDAELRRSAECRRRQDEDQRRRMAGNSDAGSDLMNPLNPISPVYVGSDCSSSDSCSSSYDSGSSSDSSGSCSSD